MLTVTNNNREFQRSSLQQNNLLQTITSNTNCKSMAKLKFSSFSTIAFKKPFDDRLVEGDLSTYGLVWRSTRIILTHSFQKSQMLK
jgi:hypothetical protein